MSELQLQPRLLSIKNAAAYLGRGIRWVYEAIATNQIKAVKDGKRTLVVVASLDVYADKLQPAKIKPMTRTQPRRRRHADNGKKQEHQPVG
jgi:excisionase family DNA binding protein